MSSKVWRHKNEISEIMGFVRIFWKNNVQEAYLPKKSISGQIVSEIAAQLCLENSIQNHLIFGGVDPKKKIIFMTSHFSTLWQLWCQEGEEPKAAWCLLHSLWLHTSSVQREGCWHTMWKKLDWEWTPGPHSLSVEGGQIGHCQS